MQRSLRLFILAGDSDYNFGDQAIEESTCRSFLSIDPTIQITVSSRLPDRIERQFGGKIRVVRKGLFNEWRLIGIALRSDIVLIGGGGLLQDDDSLIKVPYWTIRILVMRFCCRRVIGYSLGVGPLRRSFSRALVRLALRCMSHISVRDPIARSTVLALTRRSVQVVPDPALAFRAEPSLGDLDVKLPKLNLNGEQIVVGVAPRRWFPPRNRLIPRKYMALFRSPSFDDSAELVSCLTETLQQIIKNKNAIVLLLPSYSSATEGDRYVCQWLHKALPKNRSYILELDNCHEYSSACSELDVLLGGRMHPIIFAVSAGVPVIGLSYNQKFEGLFRLLNSSDAVIDVKDFVQENRVAELTALIEESIDKREEDQTDVKSLVAEFQSFNRRIVESSIADS